MGSSRNIYFYNNVIDNCNIGLRFNNSVSVLGHISNNMFNKNDGALASVDQGATQYSRSGITFSYNGQYPAAINTSTGLTISNNHPVEEANYITGSFYEIDNTNYLDGGIYIDDYETIFNDLGDASDGYGTIVNLIGFWGGRQAYYSSSIVAPSRLSITPVSPISGNEVWSGDVNITSTTTLNTGASVTIIPGTVISFPSGTSLIVNGMLNSLGSESQPIIFTSQSGTTNSSWGTITFSGSGASGSTLKYANVKYGTEVAATNTSNITIQYCNIDTTYNGIRFNNSSGSILNSIITSNSIGHGIVMENVSTTTCNDNVITKTHVDRRGVGIYFGGGSGGSAVGNDIYHWDWGICAIWSSSPTSYSSSIIEKNNRIRNCNTGFMVYRLSQPTFGIPAPSDYWNFNSLSGNSYNAKVGTSYPDYESRLIAGNNWWGSNPPNTSLFQVGSLSQFVYDSYLFSDPWSGFAKAVADNNGSSGNEAEISQGSSEDINLILYGNELRLQNKYNEAKNYFTSYITEHPDNQAAYVELYNCYNKETANEIITFFKALPEKASKDHKLLLSYLYLKEGDFREAKEVNNSIIAENQNTELATRAKLNNVYIALYNEDNVSEAITTFNEVLKNIELSNPTELSLVYNAIETYGKTYGKETNGLSALPYFESSEEEIGKQGGINELEIPNIYALDQNYPNPFNPNTTIKYQLPRDGFVTLRVYDILGNEVISLVSEQKAAGKYEVNFDASQLASGIYIYKIQAGGFVSSKKMVLLK